MELELDIEATDARDSEVLSLVGVCFGEYSARDVSVDESANPRDSDLAGDFLGILVALLGVSVISISLLTS